MHLWQFPIAAVVLGGTSIMSDSGLMWKSIVGMFLMALIGKGSDLMNFNSQVKDLAAGVIIIAAVAISMLGKKANE